METFLWSLLLAAISAITFVAYKHPLSFRKRVAPTFLFLVVGTAFYLAGTFAGSVEALSNALTEQLATINGDKGIIPFIAENLAKETLSYNRALIVCGVTFAYVIVLVFLPLILGISVKEEALPKNEV